ncbi:hypothetical protein K6U17_14455 [Vibrio fluvialis]|uniref:hypothetical protein n=1 Tax=Vibrio fluvialis TaxID=676 RepID=UPI001EEB4271|nr:hypothetical protein [Vibrio fluvialis]MCG6410420.1 hypothetical protein [Vibrio fluvialis]
MATPKKTTDLRTTVSIIADEKSENFVIGVIAEKSVRKSGKSVRAMNKTSTGAADSTLKKLNPEDKKHLKAFRHAVLKKYVEQQNARLDRTGEDALTRDDYQVIVTQRPEDAFNRTGDYVFMAINIKNKGDLNNAVARHKKGIPFYIDGVMTRRDSVTGRYTTLPISECRINGQRNGFVLAFSNDAEKIRKYHASKVASKSNYIETQTKIATLEAEAELDNKRLRDAIAKIAELEKQLAALKAINDSQAKAIVELDPDFETDSVPAVEASELTILDSYKYIEENSLKSLLMLDATFNKGTPETRILATVA